MTTGELVRFEVAENGVATLTLDQPETRNALSDRLVDALIAAFERARDDDAVRSVVLTSSHERIFCAGGDLAGFVADAPLVQRYVAKERFARLFTLPQELGKPSLCAANGHVLAGGFGLALSCDLIVAREGARFGAPEINAGLFPFMISPLIYRNVPYKKTAELMLLGDNMSADEAARLGIVNLVVPAAEFEAVVSEWAAKLAAKSPLLMRMGKDLMHRQQGMAYADALEYLRGQLAIAMTTDDIHEGVAAFFEKREPLWTGR